MLVAEFEDLRRLGVKTPSLSGKFSLTPGRGLVLLGTSGIGKTTLMDWACGCGRFQASKMILKDKNQTQPYKESTMTLRKNGKVAYLCNEASFLPWLTVRENLLLPIQLRGGSVTKIESELGHLIPLFRLVPECLDLLPHELSYGMRRRALILRCQLSGADYIFVDELMNGLDPLSRDSIVKAIESDLRKNKAYMIITHNHEPFIGHPLFDFLYINRKGELISIVPSQNSLETIYS
jgi:ABC-type multidrug transport system ATPase subunit